MHMLLDENVDVNVKNDKNNWSKMPKVRKIKGPPHYVLACRRGAGSPEK
jgi:hypothetical protein